MEPRPEVEGFRTNDQPDCAGRDWWADQCPIVPPAAVQHRGVYETWSGRVWRSLPPSIDLRCTRWDSARSPELPRENSVLAPCVKSAVVTDIRAAFVLPCERRRRVVKN